MSKKLKALEAKAIVDLEQAAQLALTLFSPEGATPPACYQPKPELVMAIYDLVPPRESEPADHDEAVTLLKSAIAVSRAAFGPQADPMLALEIFDRLFGDEEE